MISIIFGPCIGGASGTMNDSDVANLIALIPPNTKNWLFKNLLNQNITLIPKNLT